MSTRLYFLILFALLVSFASVGYGFTTHPDAFIKVDFDHSADVNTQQTWTGFVLTDSGNEVDDVDGNPSGVTIDIGGSAASARRGDPNSNNNLIEGGVGIAKEEMYRDFLYGLSDNPLEIILWGLGAERKVKIYIYAYDDESESRRAANWTANGDYLLTTDFTGGDTDTWPIDPNDPWYEFGFYPDATYYDFNGIAYADDMGSIYLTCTEDAANEDMPFAFANGLVIVTYGDANAVYKAQHPVPLDGTDDVPVSAILQWKAGDYADTHDVYFGTDEADVTDANRGNTLGVLVSQDHLTTSYTPSEFLELNTTYYWRIDEVNDTNIWKGEVWSFTTSSYLVIDDFDSYENDAALRSVWENGSSSAEVSVETTIAIDGNSMKYQYKNDLPPYYSEVYADIADMGTGNPNWLGVGARALVLNFYGDLSNPIDEQMYVKLTDGDIPPGTGTVTYGDMKNVGYIRWQKWSIALSEFNDVNLANVAGITIGFGDGGSGSAGTVYFDSIGCSSTSVSPTLLSVAAEANSTATFDITSNTSWTVSSSEYWLDVSPPSGSNNDTITVTAQQNGSLPRRATVTVSPTGDTLQTVTVTQSGIGGEGCIVPPMPPFSSLKDNAKFPDPFPLMGGSCMSWECRRAEIAELVQEFELGYKQETPYSATTGSFGYIQIEEVNYPAITVDVNDNGTSISFNCLIFYPSTGSAPYPAMVGLGFSSLDNTELSNMGVAVISFPNDDIAEQVNASSRGNGKFYDMYGSGHSAGALMAWAWGMSRLIDALEKTPEANIDPTRLGVTGCSRNGKGALICGAFDERIKLTIPQESGAGGAASWRVSQYQKYVLGQNVQTLDQIVGENCWFRANFSQFGSAVDKLPFDHHMVAALCAPRALLIIGNTWMEWLGNLSTWTNGNVTHKVWEALGIPDRMGFSQVGHSDHCVFPSSQQPEVTAYVEKFLVGGGTGDTNVMYTDGGGLVYDEEMWVDWAVPSHNPIKGDLYQDCQVGYLDLGLFAERWLNEDCLLYNWWCYEADLNCDGGVDFFDYAELAANWLEED